jgi:UDP-N-acetylglucosamine 2-epimerase (non-hydrolysing)
VENLSQRKTFDMLMEEVTYATKHTPVVFVLHPTTRERIRHSGWHERLSAQPNLKLHERLDYPEFVKLLVGATALMTDGGSNQEEAAMMGLPTLLLRRTTERPDGLDDNVVLSNLDRTCIRDFVQANALRRWPLRAPDAGSPSRIIVNALDVH